ncbi:MAG: glyoxylase-like metal-dependent hydrolase (beta-lactamase superfamily II) [Paraglaciecola sp.]|jgi:glyoxylase-like metal-dependent hydrolase (beta-lactamase superfamily II)
MIIHLLQGYIQSVYLVEYPEKLLLLDGCCRADIQLLKKFITQDLKRPFTDLKLVIVTHMHPDHAGAAHKLRRLTNCKIASANMEKAWYRGLNGTLMHLTDIALATWVAGRMGKAKKNLWYAPKLKPNYKLNDGDELPGFDEWCVLETPGHTDRDLSVLHNPSKRLYVADLIVKVKKKFIPPFPVFHPNQYRASIEKVIRLQPNSILLAHGGEVRLSESDYQHLKNAAPILPKTTWRETKIRARQMLLRNKA